MAHLSGSTSTSSVLHQHRPLARILFLFSGLLAFAVSPVGADETVSDDDGSSDHVDPHTEDDGPLSPDDDDDDPPTSRPSSDRRRTDDEAIDDYIKAHNRLPTDEPSRPSSRSSREHSSDDSSSDDGDYDYGGDAEAAAQGRSYGDFADPGVTTLPSQSILGDWFDIGHNRDEGYGFRPDVRRFLQDAELAKRTRLQRLVIRGFDSDEEGKLDSAFAVFFGQYSGENDYDEHGDCLKAAPPGGNSKYEQPSGARIYAADDAVSSTFDRNSSAPTSLYFQYDGASLVEWLRMDGRVVNRWVRYGRTSSFIGKAEAKALARRGGDPGAGVRRVPVEVSPWATAMATDFWELVGEIITSHLTTPTQGGEGVTKWTMADNLIPVPHFQSFVVVWVGVARELALG